MAADTFVVSAPSQMYANTPRFPKYVNAVLVREAASSYDVPGGSKFCIITSTVPMWASVTGTASIPSEAVSDGTSSFYIPVGMQVRLDGGDVLSVVREGSTDGVASIAHYE